MDKNLSERLRKFSAGQWPSVIDSLTLLRLVLFLETEFGLSFQRADLKAGNFANFEAVLELVKMKLDHSPGPK